MNVGIQAGTDYITGETSSKEKYAAVAAGGFAGGVATATCGPTCGAAVSAAVEDATHQGLTKGFSNIDYKQVGGEAVSGAIGGKAGKIVGKQLKKGAGLLFAGASKSGISNKIAAGARKPAKLRVRFPNLLIRLGSRLSRRT